MHTKTFHERLPAWAFASRTALSRKHMDGEKSSHLLIVSHQNPGFGCQRSAPDFLDAVVRNALKGQVNVHDCTRFLEGRKNPEKRHVPSAKAWPEIESGCRKDGFSYWKPPKWIVTGSNWRLLYTRYYRFIIHMHLNSFQQSSMFTTPFFHSVFLTRSSQASPALPDWWYNSRPSRAGSTHLGSRPLKWSLKGLKVRRIYHDIHW